LVEPYTVKVDKDKKIIRVVGGSCIYKRQEEPKKRNSELFEYRVDLEKSTSESKVLMEMDEQDITVFQHTSIHGSQLIDGKLIIIRSQYKSSDFQELTIGRDWKVETRQIPRLTRNSVSTFGAFRNLSGDVFLCGNDGYIRKVNSDGSLVWDINYKSDKSCANTMAVEFSEPANILVAFGTAFESESKFTTRDSSLWLANVDSEGNFKEEIKFEGVADFAKFPSFCLSKSDNPIVIYDNAQRGDYKIYVSKFSKNLKQDWTTNIFDGNDMVISRMSVLPLENNRTLAILSMFGSRSKPENRLSFYVLGNNGDILNRGVFDDLRIGPGFAITAFEDMIFLVTEGHIFPKADNMPARLICFKMNNPKINVNNN
jgi:hypothetical protein